MIGPESEYGWLHAVAAGDWATAETALGRSRERIEEKIAHYLGAAPEEVRNYSADWATHLCREHTVELLAAHPATRRLRLRMTGRQALGRRLLLDYPRLEQWQTFPTYPEIVEMLQKAVYGLGFDTVRDPQVACAEFWGVIDTYGLQDVLIRYDRIEEAGECLFTTQRVDGHFEGHDAHIAGMANYLYQYVLDLQAQDGTGAA